MRAELFHVVMPLLEGAPIPKGAVRAAVSTIMEGACTEAEIAAFLTALAIRGETQQDLAEAAAVMRERVTPVVTRHTGLLDTCGTGGDQLHTFNISTAAALVAAAAGVPVAKHGNRQSSSSSGSADVLEALGVNIEISAEQAGHCLDEIGIAFCFARLLHQAMKHAGPVRSALGFRTIFNLLGPLSNPAGAAFQLIGASRIETARRLAGAVATLGAERTLVVCGNDQLDEVSLWGVTTVFDVRRGEVTVSKWTTAELGLPEADAGRLRVASPRQSADLIQRVFSGEAGPAADIVLANAGAALLTAGRAATIREGIALARSTVSQGAAQAKLDELVAWTNRAG